MSWIVKYPKDFDFSKRPPCPGSIEDKLRRSYTIIISMEEYKELLLIKGKYEELKRKVNNYGKNY